MKERLIRTIEGADDLDSATYGLNSYFWDTGNLRVVAEILNALLTRIEKLEGKLK